MNWLLYVVIAWCVFCYVSPFSVLVRAQRIQRGRLPPELLDWDKDGKVRFYLANLYGGYGFSIWAPPYSVVVFDKGFFAHASTPLIKFVIAHELAHFNLGHHRKKFFAVLFFLPLFKFVRRRMAAFEDEADAVAEKVTQRKRKSFPQLR